MACTVEWELKYVDPWRRVLVLEKSGTEILNVERGVGNGDVEASAVVDLYCER